MAHLFYDDKLTVEQTVEALNRARKIKLALAIAVIVGLALAGFLFAQFSSGPAPYGY